MIMQTQGNHKTVVGTIGGTLLSLTASVHADAMTGAASKSLGDNWRGIEGAAGTALKSLAQNFVDIEKMKLAGMIAEEKASLLVGMQKDALKMVIATEEGLHLLAAEEVINAVIDAVRNTVNKAIGWRLV
jgi:hypothetical protein